MSDAFTPIFGRRSGAGGLDAASYGVSLDPEPPSLEALVGSDMRANGIDPQNADEVRTYWQRLLESKQFRHRFDDAQPYFAMPIINEKANHADRASQFDEIKNASRYQVRERVTRSGIPGGGLL